MPRRISAGFSVGGIIAKIRKKSELGVDFFVKCGTMIFVLALGRYEC